MIRLLIPVSLLASGLLAAAPAERLVIDGERAKALRAKLTAP